MWNLHFFAFIMYRTEENSQEGEGKERESGHGT